MNVTNFFDNQLQVILPELFILLSVSTLLLIGVQYSTSERDGYFVMVKPIAWMVILVTFLATLLVFNNSFNSALLIHDPATHLEKVVLNKIYILACSPISSMAMVNSSLIMGYRNIDIVMFLLSCLMLSSILFFGRNFIFSVMSKIGHIITKNIEKHFFGLPNFASNYNEGFFLIHWTVSWLICRFTLIHPIHQILLAQSELLLIKVVAQILAILLAMVLALVPSVIFTCYQELNDRISVQHWFLCMGNLRYVQLILRLHVIRCYIYASNIRLFAAFALLLTLFVGYLVTANKMLLGLFLLATYANLYYQHVTSRIMPAITKVDTVSTTLPMWYFYCNFRYRFWDNRFPKLLFKGGEYDDHEVFHFEALTKEEFDELGFCYKMSRTVEYINDSSIAPEKRLEAYNSFFKSSGDGEKSIFLQTIKEDMEKLSLKNNLLNKEGAPNIKDSQKRSFHTFPSNRLPIDGESERIISESFKVSASSSALDFESIRTQLFFDSVPWKGIDMSDEPNVESLKQAGTQFKQFNWQRHSNGLLIAETKSTSQTQSVLLKSDSSTATHKHIHKVMSEPAAAKTATELTLERASAQKAVIEVERAKVGLKNELQAMRHANLKFNLKFATSVGGAACATVLAASALYAQSQDPTTLLGELKTWVQPHLSGNGTSK